MLTRTVGEAATERHIVVEADISEKQENTKKCDKYLQACISAVQQMRKMALRYHPL